MNHKKHLLGALVLLGALAFGQANARQGGRDLSGDIGSINANANVFSVLSRLEPVPINTKGSYYYDEEWRLGRIMLFDQTQADSVLLKYDLKYHTVEVKMNDDAQPRYVEQALIKTFEWIDVESKQKKLFINPKLFGRVVNDKLIGFLELIENADGVSLYRKQDVALQKQEGYLPGISTDSRKQNWQRKEKFWISYSQQFYKLPSSKKKVEELLKSIDLYNESCPKVKGKDKDELVELVNCLGSNLNK